MTTTDRTADATTALLAALHAGGYAVETLVTGAVIVDGQHIDASAWDTMAMSWDGTADGLEELGWDMAAEAMRDERARLTSAAMRAMALSSIDWEGDGEDRCLAEAIPLPLARELASRLIACGIEASVATDNDDREMGWVYARE